LAEVRCAIGADSAFDLIILDIDLGPDEPDGLDVFQWLTERKIHARIVFLTAHSPAHPLVKKARGLSPAHVFEKPEGIAKLQVFFAKCDPG
jgi:DNA-binding response OmpR family regulator